MDVNQYLNFKNAQIPNRYIPIDEPTINTAQTVALHTAMMKYLNSNCINQKAPQVENLKTLLKSSNSNVLKFLKELKNAIIYNYLLHVLPVNNEYVYDAGICNNSCGYGKNRVVAILINKLLETNIPIQDIEMSPDLMLLSFWTAFMSETLNQERGTGIIYDFTATTC